MLGVLAWSGIAVIAGILHRHKFVLWLQEYKFPLIIVMSLTVLKIYQFIRGIHASRALDQDCQAGWVLVVHEKEPEQGHYERLPESGALWSVEGRPAEWRLQKASMCQPSAAVGRRE
jgi:hypothetical protein